jgi:polar amino acid transport system substrate-binding protein
MISSVRSAVAGAVFAATTIAAGTTGALAADTLKVGFAAEPYPPFTSLDSSGKWTGFEVELAAAICEEMGAKCENAPVAWDGIIPALAGGKIDMIVGSMSITDDRRKVIDFSDRYYYTAAAYIGPKSLDVKIPEDLGGLILAVQGSTTHATFARQELADTGVEIKLYDTEDREKADLLAGRVDLVLADQAAMAEFLAQDDAKDFEIKAIAPAHPTFGEGIGVGLRKDSPLKADINAAIAELLENGTYDKIADKYFDFDIYGPRG